MSARAYPGRDTARILRRARSLARGQSAATNERAHCCARPDHVATSPTGPLVTQCRNCGAVV